MTTGILQDTATGVSVADRPEDLRAFRDPECAAAIWQRWPQAGFQGWIDALDPQHLPQGRIILRPNVVAQAVAQLCDIAGTPQHPYRAQLVDDVAALVEMFADLMHAPYLRLRMEAVCTNACRKFHRDAVSSRLVCTYRGAGTQYGTAASGRDPARVFSVPTGSPILLRGSLWPETPASGLLHRSPPIEGTGETRLLLVLDPILDHAGEA